MENIIFSANVVLPLLLLMAVGYVARQRKMLDGKTASVFNSIAFSIFLPCLLFNNVRYSDVALLDNAPLFTFIIIGSLSSFGLATLFVLWVEKENFRRGVMIQGLARTNYSLFGIPLLTMLMPDEDTAVAAILIAVIIPIYNIVSVVVLTYFGSKTANLKSILLGIAKNPLIIATLGGLLFLVQGWSLPAPIDTALFNLGSIATPLSLFLLGASFEFNKLHAILKQTIITVTGRLIVIPAIALTTAALLGFRGVELACILIAFASPTAVSSFPMAEKLGGDSHLASSVVLFTSSLCTFSLFLFILILKSLALI